MQSVIRNQFDASLALALPGGAVVTADGASTLVDINKITRSVKGALNGRFGEMEFDVVLHVVSLDHTTGDETYTLNFNTYDANGANAVTHFSKTLTTADVGKTFVYKFDTITLGVEDANAAQFGIAVDVGGTTPSLGYWAFVSSDND